MNFPGMHSGYVTERFTDCNNTYPWMYTPVEAQEKGIDWKLVEVFFSRTKPTDTATAAISWQVSKRGKNQLD